MQAWMSGLVGVEPGQSTLWLIAAFLLSFIGSASAQDATAPRIVVVQREGGDVPHALRDETDRLLVGALDARPRFASTYVSKVPLDDIELAAGCSAREPDCTQRIAASLDADGLLVRELTRDRQGQSHLTLIAYDDGSALVSRRVVSVVGDAQHAPSSVVPSLVDRLYPDTRVMPSREAAPDQGATAKVVGWSSAGAGASLLVVGSVMAALSKHDHAAYQRMDIRTPNDVDHASGLLSRSQDRARIANGLLIGGATAGLVGTATLLWTYLRGARHSDETRPTVGVVPVSSGVGMSLAGAWRGGL